MPEITAEEARELGAKSTARANLEFDTIMDQIRAVAPGNVTSIPFPSGLHADVVTLLVERLEADPLLYTIIEEEAVPVTISWALEEEE